MLASYGKFPALYPSFTLFMPSHGCDILYGVASGRRWEMIMRRGTLALTSFALMAALCVQAQAQTSQAQAPKPAPSAASAPSAKPTAASFPAYIQSLWPLAQAAGISRGTFDTAFRGVNAPEPSVAALTKKQSEFVKPIWGYLDSAISSGRIAQGRGAAGEWASALAQAESRYGVPKEIILGIWGMETNFGSFKGNLDVIRALTTLAYLRYRDTFFRDELIAALTILEKGQADRADLKGSWAGAMGHTQFMPSSYLKYAVTGSGAGAADIWDSPADAIASTGNYLKQFGWQAGLPWGIEVELPGGYDLRLVQGAFSQFRAAGIAAMSGAALPSSGEAKLFLPAGITGPAFLVTANYDVIKKYNNSDAYALAVAHLGDRIAGRGAIEGTWPRSSAQLSQVQRQEVQRRLKALGLYNDKIDGRLGSGTREAVRQFQLKAGLPADGYATPAVLARMKAQ
jgi:membrane-bound lytic murein transglycosylase B